MTTSTFISYSVHSPQHRLVARRSTEDSRWIHRAETAGRGPLSLFLSPHFRWRLCGGILFLQVGRGKTKAKSRVWLNPSPKCFGWFFCTVHSGLLCTRYLFVDSKYYERIALVAWHSRASRLLRPWILNQKIGSVQGREGEDNLGISSVMVVCWSLHVLSFYVQVAKEQLYDCWDTIDVFLLVVVQSAEKVYH